jgi:hypothetical protein
MRKKHMIIATACVLTIAAIVVCVIAFLNRDDGPDLPLYSASSYEDLRSVLDSANDTFLLPDKQIMLSDYSFGFYNILLDEPGGVPVGYNIYGLDQPGADHYKMTMRILCTQISGSVDGGQLLETYEEIDIITDGDGRVVFEMWGFRYCVESDISSDLGGFQGEDLEIAEALRIAKNMIDQSLIKK